MRTRLASLIVVKQEPLDDYGGAGGALPAAASSAAVTAVELNNNGFGAGQYEGLLQPEQVQGYCARYEFGGSVLPTVGCYGPPVQQDLNNNNQQHQQHEGQTVQDFQLFHEKKCKCHLTNFEPPSSGKYANYDLLRPR